MSFSFLLKRLNLKVTVAATASSTFLVALMVASILNDRTPAMAPRAAVVAVCHGGGPMPALSDPAHASLISSLRTRVPAILKLNTPSAPRAIVLVTAHWQTEHPTISNGETHDLLYDYGGFPKEAYELKYPAMGDPGVAEEVKAALQKGGFEDVVMDSKRGWDHGVFIPLLLIAPLANIPIIQLSVLSSSSASSHFSLGRALAPLRSSNVAIIGSGMPSFHNLPAMFSGKMNSPAFADKIEKWSEKLSEVVKIKDAEERGRELEKWREWEGSVQAHPWGGEEHFLPLVVCAGAGGEGEARGWGDEVLGSEQFTYYWE